MNRLKGIGLAALMAVSFMGCSSNNLAKFNASVTNFFSGVNTLSTNINNTIVSINADIAAQAPTVAANCADLQKAAMLIQPFLPTSGKAPQYFSAANGALTAYCTAIPTDIQGTAAAVAAAVAAAKSGYNNVKAGS